MHNAASHPVEHAEYNRRRNPFWRHIGRHLCTSICTSVTVCMYIICIQINVLIHDAMEKMVLAERGSLSEEAPTHHVIEAIQRISHVIVLVNALFWSTLWSTH